MAQLLKNLTSLERQAVRTAKKYAAMDKSPMMGVLEATKESARLIYEAGLFAHSIGQISAHKLCKFKSILDMANDMASTFEKKS